MATEIKIARNRPKFIRKDWHKLIRLGSHAKKERKWRASKGRHAKIRMGRKGQSARPKIGWGHAAVERNKVEGFKVMRVENVNQLSSVPKGHAIIIGSVGKRNRLRIVESAKKMNLTILNNYKEKK